MKTFEGDLKASCELIVYSIIFHVDFIIKKGSKISG